MSCEKDTRNKKMRRLSIGLSVLMIVPLLLGLIPSEVFAADESMAESSVKLIWKGHDNAIAGASVLTRLLSKNIDTDDYTIVAETVFKGNEFVAGGETRSFGSFPTNGYDDQPIEYSVLAMLLVILKRPLRMMHLMNIRL